MSTEIKTEEKKEGGGSKGILILLLLIILGLGGMCFYLFSELDKAEIKTTEVSKVTEEKTDEIDDLLTQLDEKEAEYSRIIVEKEALGYDVSDLEQERAALLEDISTWKAKAAKYKREGRKNEKLAKTLKLKNAQYTLELQEKDQMITFLRSENDSLNTTSQELDQQRHVQGNIIEAQNEKIKLGSVLKAEGIKITIRTDKQKTVEKQPFRAKKIEALVLQFNIAENNIAAYNKKEIAMRLVGPDGSVLFDLANGGGPLKTSENETVYYTLKQNLLFDNTNQIMTFPYFKGSEWEIGSYQIQIYADGNVVGNTTFELK
jgi:hypothetical protein